MHIIRFLHPDVIVITQKIKPSTKEFRVLYKNYHLVTHTYIHSHTLDKLVFITSKSTMGNHVSEMSDFRL